MDPAPCARERSVGLLKEKQIRIWAENWSKSNDCSFEVCASSGQRTQPQQEARRNPVAIGTGACAKPSAARSAGNHPREKTHPLEFRERSKLHPQKEAPEVIRSTKRGNPSVAGGAEQSCKFSISDISCGMPIRSTKRGTYSQQQEGNSNRQARPSEAE